MQSDTNLQTDNDAVVITESEQDEFYYIADFTLQKRNHYPSLKKVLNYNNGKSENKPIPQKVIVLFLAWVLDHYDIPTTPLDKKNKRDIQEYLMEKLYIVEETNG